MTELDRRMVSEVIPYASNSRTHSEEQVTAIAASIKEFGFTNPVLIDEGNGIIAGHGRVLAAKKLGLTEVPVIVLSHLTEAQRKAYVIADNKLALNAGWDLELLSIEMRGLNDAGFDLNLIGFSADEIANLLVEKTDGLTDPDDVPELSDVVVTKAGDVWRLGKHRLMCGDSNDITAIDCLLNGSSPDAVVTDPPYGIGIDGQKKSVGANPKHNRKAHDFKGWDSERPDPGIFNYILSLNVPSLIWGGNYFADLLPASRGWVYWSKGQDGLSMSDGELAWSNKDKVLRSVTVNRGALNKEGSVHPTQKPYDVIRFSLDYLEAGKVILDLFGGSGTTLMAAERSRRHARLMELDPAYCDVIVKRWEDFTGKTAVREGSGEIFPTIKKDAA
jgi:hypothetical protein